MDSNEARVDYHPRFLITRPVFEAYSISLNTRLLGSVATYYEFDVSALKPVEITTTHELASPVTSQAGIMPNVEYGRFILTELQYEDGRTVDSLGITIRFLPNVIASYGGLVPHMGRLGDKNGELLNTNLSATLIHEIGHFAAYYSRKKAADERPSPTWFQRILGKTDAQYTRKMQLEEEIWVRAKTKDLLDSQPDLKDLIRVRRK